MIELNTQETHLAAGRFADLGGILSNARRENQRIYAAKRRCHGSDFRLQAMNKDVEG